MWKLDPGERIAQWRIFRKSLDLLPLEIAIANTALYWQNCPFSPYYLDPADPESWPDPWSLVYENHYCDIAKCLGIVYTIALTRHKIDLDIEIRVYQDIDTKYTYNLVWINQGKYIANLIDGELANTSHLKSTLVLQKTHTAIELQLNNY